MIEDKTDESRVKILCDPWLDGEEYLGSWAIYPPYEFVLENFSDVDYIYVSHIHPDHGSAKTLEQLNKNTLEKIRRTNPKAAKFMEKYGVDKTEWSDDVVYEYDEDESINGLS